MKAPAQPSNAILSFPFDEEGRRKAAEALAEGLVMSYPTETSYALGGNALAPALVEAVFGLKGRENAKALLLLIAGERQARELTGRIDPAAGALMKACWPGPLTLVLWAGAELPAHLRDERGTVALRHSPHPVVAELLRIGGAPLIGTSANHSGQSAAQSAGEVAAIFGEAVAVTIDDGVDRIIGGRTAAGGAPSTVLDATKRPFRVLREGAVCNRILRDALVADFPGAAP